MRLFSFYLCSGSEIVEHVKGSDLNEVRLERHGFGWPMMVEDKAGLGLKVPRSEFSIRNVEELVGMSQ